MSTPYDFSYTNIEIDAGEAQLATDLGTGVQFTQIGDRKLGKYSLKERLDVLMELAANVEIEQNGAFLNVKFEAAE